MPENRRTMTGFAFPAYGIDAGTALRRALPVHPWRERVLPGNHRAWWLLLLPVFAGLNWQRDIRKQYFCDREFWRDRYLFVHPVKKYLSAPGWVFPALSPIRQR